MAYVIGEEMLDAIRFEANYWRYKDALLAIDVHRFRALGDVHTETFIRHAVTWSADNGITYLNDTAYVMFLMLHLGSFFYEDPRYAAITTILSQEPEFCDDRTDRARRVFIAGSKTLRGEDGARQQKALDRFVREEQHRFNDDTVNLHQAAEFLRGLFPGDTAIASDDVERKLCAAAREAGEALGLAGNRAEKACLAVGFWLGTGFYKDPLYPWIRDLTANRSLMPEDRLRIFVGYARKRLLSTMEGPK
ncbi:hypothetical protein [Martelella mangrovi]|uniref:DUF2236 domain-containing protein n=1 Tax=Martelella mangrovi TaxID=1397477 RepID=A0ABV2IH27_9HYPH